MARPTLHELRTNAGLSQDDLAELVGVSQPTISRWEDGTMTPNTDKLRSLAKALGVTIEDLPWMN